MQSNDKPIELRFGEAVSEGRRVQRVSQKQLAELLTRGGLPLDASAISRIEKGTRAIRLSEAVAIADVLGFSLADVEEGRDPQDDLERQRKNLDAALDEVHREMMAAGDAVAEIVFLVEQHPDLLQSMKDETGSVPVDVADYLKRAQNEWSANFLVASIAADIPDEDVRSATRSLVAAVANLAIGGADG